MVNSEVSRLNKKKIKRTKLRWDKGKFEAWHILNTGSEHVYDISLSSHYQKTSDVFHEEGIRSLVRVEYWLQQHGQFLFVLNNMNYIPNNTLSNWLDRIDMIKSRSKQMNWKDESKTLEKRLNIRINWTKSIQKGKKVMTDSWIRACIAQN